MTRLNRSEKQQQQQQQQREKKQKAKKINSQCTSSWARKSFFAALSPGAEHERVLIEAVDMG